MISRRGRWGSSALMKATTARASSGSGRHQDRGGLGVVLHLGEKVQGHEPGGSGVIRQDQGLAGPRRGAHAHLAEHQKLGRRDILVARAHESGSTRGTVWVP